MEIATKTVAASEVLLKNDAEMIKANIQLERAKSGLEDVTDEYSNIDGNFPDEFWKIRLCHQEYKTRADITLDCLYKMEKEIATVQELLHTEFKKRRDNVAVRI